MGINVYLCFVSAGVGPKQGGSE